LKFRIGNYRFPKGAANAADRKEKAKQINNDETRCAANAAVGVLNKAKTPNCGAGGLLLVL
jgi:hypothetical protein